MKKLMIIGLIAASVGLTSCKKTCSCDFKGNANPITDPLNFASQTAANAAAAEAGSDKTKCLAANVIALSILDDDNEGSCAIK